MPIVNASPPSTQRAITLRDLARDRVVIALILADMRLDRSADRAELASRAELALNLGDAERLNEARADLVSAFQSLYPEMDDTIAATLAQTALTTAVTSLSAQKGGR